MDGKGRETRGEREERARKVSGGACHNNKKSFPHP